MRCPNPQYDNGIRAGIVHHTAGSNEYAPEDSAGIIRSIYEYHTRTLGWCDIAYNALVDKYGQVFEGRAGGITKPVEGAHTGGFNRDTWGVAMLGNFDLVPPTPIQLRNTGQVARMAHGPGPHRPEGHGRARIGRRLVLQVPVRRHPDAADDLHPPRRRHHRMPGQRGICGDGPDPRHRRTIQRSAGSRRTGGVAARRCDLRAMGVVGRGEQPPRCAEITRGLRRGAGPVRRTSSGARSTGRRRAGPNRSPARSTKRGGRWASSAARSACRPAARSRSRSGSCRTSSTAR